MRTFKKIITIALVLSMLAALFVPMGVTAAATKSWTKTSELWASNSNTELSAVKTAQAPTIDGLMDDMLWDNAQPLVLNQWTYQTIQNAAFTKTNNVKIYMLYDNDNLYILQDVPAGSNMSDNTINILPEKDYVAKTLENATAGTVPFDGFMPRFAAGTTEVEKDGTVTITNRRYVYQDQNMNKNNGSKETGWTSDEARITGLSAKYSGSKNGGYKMEIQIAWRAIGCDGPTNFGVKFMNHISTGEAVQWYGGAMNWDCAYHDPVALKDSKGNEPAYIAAARQLEADYVAPAAKKTTWTNTNEMWAPNSNTNLSAYLTSTAPTLDGEMNESDWANAVPLVADDFTRNTVVNAFWSTGKNFKVYMMYDQDNLYLFEEVGANSAITYTDIVPEREWAALNFPKTATSDLSGHEGTNNIDHYYASYIDSTVDKSAIPAFHGYIPCFAPASAAEGPATITSRRWYYNNNNMNLGNGQKEKGWEASTKIGETNYSRIEGLEAYYIGSTATGYTMEIKIPWEYLNCDGPTPFSIKFNTGNYHIGTGGNNLFYGVSKNGDIAYGDPVTLLESGKKATEPAYSVEGKAIKAAYNEWVAVLKTETAGTFTIDSKEELYALTLWDKNIAKSSDHRDKGEAAYNGKVFKLTTDVDFNPHIDWSKFDFSKITADSAKQESTYEYTPIYSWYGFHRFAGILDGQGHRIDGLWNATGIGKGRYGGGFIGEVYNDRGVDHGIKNLILGSGYMYATTINDCTGGVVGSVRTSGSFFKNIYVGENYTFDTTISTSGYSTVYYSDNITRFIGSMFGRLHDYDVRGGKNTITVDNCVYAGSFLIIQEKDANGYNVYLINQYTNLISGTTNMKANTTYLYMTDCMFTGRFFRGGIEIADKEGLIGIGTHINQGSAASTTRVYSCVEEAKADTANALYLSEMENGDVLPVVIADMVSGMYAQNNKETNTAVRIVSEVDKTDWSSFGYRVKITRADGAVANVDYTANRNVYSYVTAAGKQVTANSAAFDKIAGEYLYAVEISGIDTNTTYTVEITPVWTKDATVIEGVTRTLTLPRA